MKNSKGLMKTIVNIGIGEGISSILGVINLFILIKILGVEQNGVYLMVQAYSLLINDIFNFQSYNAVIKFLASIKTIEGKINIIKQSYICDIATAVLGYGLGILFIPIIITIMNWSNDMKVLLFIYLLTVLFNINGTPIGIIRFYNQFNKSVIINLVNNSIKTIIYLIISANNIKSIGLIIIVEVVLIFIKNLALNIVAYDIVKKNLGLDSFKCKILYNREFLKFNIYSNLTLTLDIPFKHIATFVINKYLGFNDITIYKVFQNVGSIMSKITTPITQVIYPEMSKKFEENRFIEAKVLFNKMKKYIVMIGIPIMIVILISSEIWLKYLGQNFDTYRFELGIYLLYIVFTSAYLGIHPLFMAMGYVKYNIPILIISNCIYIISIFTLIKIFGLLGVIIALIMQSGIVILIKSIVVSRYESMYKTDKSRQKCYK